MTEILSAVFWCFVTVMLMAILIGKMFDGITGWWQIVPLIGQFVTLAVAIAAFRRGLKQYDTGR